MKKVVIFLVAVSAAAQLVSAEGVSIAFDGKAGAGVVDFKALLPDLPKMELKAEPAPTPKSARLYGKRKACETVEFWASDGTNIRRDVMLYSNVGSDDYESAVAHLTVSGPALASGQTERIEVCYDFAASEGSYRIKKSPFQYSVSMRNLGGYNAFELNLTRI